MRQGMKTGWCKFKGNRYYLLDGGAMALPHCVNKDGKPTPETLAGTIIRDRAFLSFAHIDDDSNVIERFGVSIGHHDDLIFEEK